jgi:hypothetical protein
MATANSNNAPLRIGAEYNHNVFGAFFNGTIDEVLIANRSLSASEVLAHYNAGKAKHADWDASGKWNSALKFNGVNDYVNAGNIPVSNSMSTFAWMKAGAKASQAIIGKYDSGLNARSWYVLSDNGAGSKLSVVLSDDGSFDASHRKNYVGSLTAFDGSWHHVGFTFNAGVLNLYVDGVLDTNPTKTYDAAITSIYSSTTPVTVGAVLSSGAPANFLNGSIDEVRIWNRALSASEIRQQYYSSLNKFAPDKWLFISNQTGLPAGTHTYYLYANGAGDAADYSDERTLRVS